jgi:hypothetical protein
MKTPYDDFISGLGTGQRLTWHGDIEEALIEAQQEVDALIARYGQPRRGYGHVPFLVPYLPAQWRQEAGPHLPGEGPPGESPAAQAVSRSAIPQCGQKIEK